MTFDLKAAREICIKLGLKYPARSLIDQEYQCSLAAEMLPAALDEIEQQNAYIEQLSKQCQAFIHDEEIHGWIQAHHYIETIRSCKLLDVAKKWHAAYRKAQNSNLVRKQLCEQKDECISEQAKRIAELENSLGISAIETRDFQIIVRKQHAALKKLGQAKRERGKALVEERARFNVAMKVVPLNTNFPNSDHKKAREQLRREGLL